MEKIKKVIKEEKEVEVIKITLHEFVNIAAQECSAVFKELTNGKKPEDIDILISFTCAKFSGQLANRLFGEDNVENETNKEREEN